MPLQLLVTSPSNLKMAKKYLPLKDVEIVIVKSPPSKRNYKVFEGEVWALGGGSVIDTAKLIAGDKPCNAIPTTASGAACTSHACVWTKTKKIDIQTPRPVVSQIYEELPIKLSEKNLQRTIFDCTCHILESRHSKKAEAASNYYCRLAEETLLKFHVTQEIKFLIEAGNWAGRAIEITGTNFIHAISYVLTLDYGYCHGDALKEAIDIRKRDNWNKIVTKAKKYKKFFDSTLV